MKACFQACVQALGSDPTMSYRSTGVLDKSG
jgi:hypothetical protein